MASAGNEHGPFWGGKKGKGGKGNSTVYAKKGNSLPPSLPEEKLEYFLKKKRGPRL